MDIPITTPEEIAARPRVEPPYLHLPDRTALFAERAARLRTLAPGHPLEGYLGFIAAVADAQQAELAALPPAPLPDAAHLARAVEHAMPPLSPSVFPRDARWRAAFRGIVSRVRAASAPPQAELLATMATLADATLEAQADKLLESHTFELDRALAPLVGAALQVHWTDLVTRMPVAAFPRIDVPGVCPCCGGRPTASIVRIGGDSNGYRYVSCSLCAAQWHLVRVKCVHCDSTKGIHYQSIEGGTPGIKAECCDECDTYLKIVYMDRDPLVDPQADDLAAVALDLLVADLGKRASGINFMLIHGDDEA